MQNSNQSFERVKDILNQMGKQSPTSGSGKALQKQVQDSGQNSESSLQAQPQGEKACGKQKKNGTPKDPISENREGLIQQMGQKKQSSVEGESPAGKDDKEQTSEQNKKCETDKNESAQNITAGKCTGRTLSREELIDSIEKTCGEDTELSRQTGEYLKDMVQQARNQMKREEKRNAKQAEIDNIKLKVKSPYLQGEIKYINQEARDIQPGMYEKLVDSCRGNIHGLESQLKRIFQEDRTRKSYTTSGRLSVRRACSDRITARLFTKKTQPDNKIDMSVLILVDQSGSMRGSKIENAQKCACMLSEALGKFRIKTKIVGFTTHNSPVFIHYGSWKNTTADRRKLTSMYGVGGTFLGFSIRYAAELLKKSSSEHKIMIIITDGRPEDPHYKSTDDAFGDVADAVRGVKKFSDLIGIGLFQGVGCLEAVYERIFGRDFLSLQKADDLPSLVAEKMRTIVKSW